MTQGEKELIRQEMLQDNYEEAQHEDEMRDPDYAIGSVIAEFDLSAAREAFEKASKALSDYGHEFSIYDLLAEA